MSGGTGPRILNPGSALRRMFTSRPFLSNYCVRSAVKLAEPDTVQNTLLSVSVENATPYLRPHIQYHCTDCSVHMKANSYENKFQIFYIILLTWICLTRGYYIQKSHTAYLTNDVTPFT
jgi:hypothetical protein